MEVVLVESQDDAQMIDNIHWDAPVADIADMTGNTSRSFVAPRMASSGRNDRLRLLKMDLFRIQIETRI